VPISAAYVWSWFWQLDCGRSAGFSANQIAWADIKAWSELTGIRLRRWELRALRAMDAVRLAGSVAAKSTDEDVAKQGSALAASIKDMAKK
jgi:hypothetical protein